MNIRATSTPFQHIFRLHASEKTDTCRSKAIEVGNSYHVEVTGMQAGPLRQITPSDITQRNWSRVGTAVLEMENSSKRRCFVKQYIDRSGVLHPDHLQYEYEGALLASKILDGIVKVPSLLLKDDERLINVFEHTDVITVDELLRSDETRFWHYYPLLLEQLSDVLNAMREGANRHDTANLPVKTRNYRSQGLAINFKGFEIRNTGYQLSPGNMEDSSTSLPPVVMFDFVRPYIAPIEEAAAKLLVSIALLNWGKPLGRFIKGHDNEILDMAFYYIGQWTNREAMEAELAIQQGFRFDTIKGANRSESQLKKVGLNVVGRIYLNRIREWTSAHFPADDSPTPG